MVRIHGIEALFLVTLLATPVSTQEPEFPGPETFHSVQEPRDLRNSSLLPLAPPPLEQSLARLDQWIEKKQWSAAGRLLQDLVRDRHIDLVPHDRRSAVGFLEHLASRLTHPELVTELERLDRPDWLRLWFPGLADEGRLRALLDLFPFRAACGEALLNLADLYLEAGRPREALAVLGRRRLLPPAGRQAGLEQQLAQLRELALGMTLGPPAQPVATNLVLESLMLKVVEAGPGGPHPRWPERGLLEGRASSVLCAGQLCLHDGKRLWRVQPDPLQPLGEPLLLTEFLNLEGPDWAQTVLAPRPDTRHLPRCMAAQGERLALVAGERPEPGARAGTHGLFCLRIWPGDRRPSVLWSLPGRFQGALPAGLTPEDEQALRRGPLSFGAGPVWVDQDLVALIHAPLDKTRVTCFLARLDGQTGQPLWIRFLAQGAPEALDPLFDRLAAMPFPELSGAPICLLEGSLFVATDLGTIQALEAWTGRPLWAFQSARARPEAGEERGFLSSTLAGKGDRLVAGLRDSEWVYLLRAFPEPGEAVIWAPPLPRRGLTWLVGIEGSQAYFTNSDRGEFTLVRLSLPEGAWCESVPLPSGDKFLGPPVLCLGHLYFCTERYLFRADLGRDLFVEDPILEMPEAGPHLLGPLLPWQRGLLSIGAQGVGLWRPGP